MRIVTKDGKEKVLDYKNWVVNLPDGTTAVRGLVRDVTEKMKIRHQFRHAQKMESIGILASGISHNFRNILSGIMSHGQLIQERYKSYPELQRYANEIIKLTKTGSKLISDILGFSWKGEKDTKEILNFSHVLEDACNILRHSLGDHIKIVKYWPDDLPIFGNRSSLLQVIINICTNARDAMPDGGTLRITASKQDNDILLEIEDTGCGMDEETKSKIFDPFFTTKERGKGTGLGLYTTYGIVKEHGGRIEVESSPGKGSIFRIYIPSKKKMIDKQKIIDAGDFKRKGKKVLIVDDDINTLLPMRDLLLLRGYQVECSNCGEDALVKFFSWQPDVILIDRKMPDMDGKEVLRKIFSKSPDACIILISGYENEGLNELDPELKVQSRAI
jgi:nitrogen-specific signal transduction histidine kinase/CheY-like chemotaxis protein